MTLKKGKELQTDNVFKAFLFSDNLIENNFSSSFTNIRKRGFSIKIFRFMNMEFC